MRKNIKTVLILGVFVLGLAYTNTARAEEVCDTVTVYCANGNSGYGLACGANADEMTDEVSDLADAICNPD